jgi:RNA polymerase-binding transcription factor DksA
MATQNRTELDIAHFQARLREEKGLAEETITAVRSSEGADPTIGQSAELSDSDENHPADAGTDLFLREEDLALIQNARDILTRIERAFEKIEDGTYGLSDRSGEPIPVERLEAIPYATLTVDEEAVEEAV